MVPIVTGFLGKGFQTGAITTLGRGGSDLSATVIGAALELEEVQVWKDVDGESVEGGPPCFRMDLFPVCLSPPLSADGPIGVLTSDPRIVTNTRPVNNLTFEEATELAYYGAQASGPAPTSGMSSCSYAERLPLLPPFPGPTSSGHATCDSLGKDECQG